MVHDKNHSRVRRAHQVRHNISMIQVIWLFGAHGAPYILALVK
nr:hypothetical protein [Alysiella crassa]